VWTGTNLDGTKTANTAGDWHNPLAAATVGNIDYVNKNWINYGTVGGNSAERLYGISPPIPYQGVGDFNRDGHVDAKDIKPMELALTNLDLYESTYGVSPVNFPGFSDVNGDGQFTNADLQTLLDLLNSGGGSRNSVPEPSTLVLAVLLASAGLLLRYRR
jgi:hypothetical protein